jgi:hypothetical protein
MYQGTLKGVVSGIVITGHFFLISLLLFMFFIGGFLFTEMTTSLAIILPMTGIYTSAVIKDIIVHSDVSFRSKDVRVLSIGYTILAILLPLMFFTYLFCIVILKALNIGMSDFEQFKTLLGIGETVFAVYLGQVVHSIFNVDPPASG